MTRFAKGWLISGLVILLIGIYIYGAIQNLKRVNVDMVKGDQSAYMNFAQKMHESKYTYLGGRNRMPVYPFIQSIFYRKKMSDHVFFTQGKYINIGLSILMLGGLLSIFKYLFSDWLLTVNLTLIVAFFVFMFKAAYFQSELLFYFFNFLCFLLLFQTLLHPSWKWGLSAGFMLGLTHLTKASVLPGVLIWLLIALILLSKLGIRSLRNNSTMEQSRTNRNKFNSVVVCILLLIFGFMVTIYPYISDTKNRFGSYFYNVNSTFYMWYDSWEEVESGTRAHGDRIGWPDMAPESIPGPVKYITEHSLRQIVLREARGLQALFIICYNSYGYLKYAFIFFGFFIILVLRSKNKIFNMESEYMAPVLFCVAYFILYLLLYAWYVPIAFGDRFVLGQFLPFMFIIAFGIENISRPDFNASFDQKACRLHVFNIFVLVLLIPDIIFSLRKVLVMYGGGD